MNQSCSSPTWCRLSSVGNGERGRARGRRQCVYGGSGNVLGEGNDNGGCVGVREMWRGRVVMRRHHGNCGVFSGGEVMVGVMCCGEWLRASEDGCDVVGVVEGGCCRIWDGSD
ncbi:hypothetical protein ACFE04_027893 [Oxalis oulophora]